MHVIISQKQCAVFGKFVFLSKCAQNKMILCTLCFKLNVMHYARERGTGQLKNDQVNGMSVEEVRRIVIEIRQEQILFSYACCNISSTGKLNKKNG
jgi:hypothetical protein